MNKAIFLDRDGVINVEKNYVHSIADFEFIDGIFPLLRTAQQSGYLPIVITNQAGIGRGYYSEDDFHELTEWMKLQFLEEEITIAAVYYCPYHESAGIGKYKKESFDRKPNPGMILQAKQDLRLNLNDSLLIGDKMTDLEAGRRAGVGRLFLFADCDPDDGDDYKQISFLGDVKAYLSSSHECNFV